MVSYIALYDEVKSGENNQFNAVQNLLSYVNVNPSKLDLFFS